MLGVETIGANAGFLKGEESTGKKGVQKGPASWAQSGPMLKSLHRGPKVPPPPIRPWTMYTEARGTETLQRRQSHVI